MLLPNEVIFVSGQRGSGKSFFTKVMSRTFPRVIIWDTMGEYETDILITDMGELIDFLERDQEKNDFFHVGYQALEDVEEFPLFCEAILARGDVYVIIEELDVVTSPYNIPIEFARLIKYGRHYGIQLMGVSRRPAEVSRQFTSQSTRFVCFPQHEPNDIRYFTSVFGPEATKLTSLPKYHYLDINYASDKIDLSPQKPIKPPRIKKKKPEEVKKPETFSLDI